MTGSYYGRPIIKEPVWKPEVPFYFFTGGLAGASARSRSSSSGPNWIDFVGHACAHAGSWPPLSRS